MMVLSVSLLWFKRIIKGEILIMCVKKEILENEHIALVKLNRPDRLNTLTSSMVQQLYETFEEIENNPSILVMIITGEGRAFCAGSDLKDRVKKPADYGDAKQDDYLIGIRKMNSALENMTKVTIAALNGHTIGAGLEISLCCDIRIASLSGKIGLPEAKVGAIAGGGGTQRLPRLVGIAKALEMLYTGAKINADEAEKIGLVNYAVESEEVLPKALDIANTIAQNAPLSLKAYKRVVREGMKLSLEEGLDMEMEYANKLAESEDRKEGMLAFLEKRRPNFSGK